MKKFSRRAVLVTVVTAVGLVGVTTVAVNARMADEPVMNAPTIGQAAPAFIAVDSKGKQHKLADLKGKVVVLEWTNNGCPYVKKHYESSNMQNLQKQAKKAGVVWLSVVSSAPWKQGHVDGEGANELTASRNAAPAAVLLDPKGVVGRSYAAVTTPHMFVIDTNGVLRYAGGIDSIASTNTDDVQKADPFFKNAMESVVKGEAVTKPVTRPYGCSVKY
jgi:peroxiredoxin